MIGPSDVVSYGILAEDHHLRRATGADDNKRRLNAKNCWPFDREWMRMDANIFDMIYRMFMIFNSKG